MLNIPAMAVVAMLLLPLGSLAPSSEPFVDLSPGTKTANQTSSEQDDARPREGCSSSVGQETDNVLQNENSRSVARSMTPADPEPDLTPAAIPIGLRIPALGVDAEVEPVGIDSSGHMAEPSEWNDVGWYEPGPRPGSRGNAVLAGHYDSPFGPAVFYRIDEFEPGDEIFVDMDNGEQLRFRVSETLVVRTKDAPLQRIFGPSGDRNLNLITCYGVWDPSRNLYDERLVVFAELVDA